MRTDSMDRTMRTTAAVLGRGGSMLSPPVPRERGEQEGGLFDNRRTAATRRVPFAGRPLPIPPRRQIADGEGADSPDETGRLRRSPSTGLSTPAPSIAYDQP